MIHPAARVLPSNAPPLRDGSDASRVLQEHSGNRQHNDYSVSNGYEQKYAGSALAENTYPTQQQHGQLYNTQPQYRTPHRYGYANNRRPHHPHEDDAWVAQEAKKLYRRFFQSEQYTKYRTKQHKEDKGGQDQKWPDHLEEAFFRALVRWPPMGRRKNFWKDKQRGRNELIADYIEQLTGEARTRKQVSSHIQVLKPFVETDPHIMAYLSKHDWNANGGRSYGPHGSSYPTGRRMSNYPVVAPPQGVRNMLPHLSQQPLLDLQKVKHNLDVFEPTDFQMFVQRKYRLQERPNEERIDRLHTYTASISKPRMQDIAARDWGTLFESYPLLSPMHRARPLDCNVLVAEASLAIPTETWKDTEGKPLGGIELGISFMCTSRPLPANARVVCRNSFYRNNQYLEPQSGQHTVDLTPNETEGGVETQVKFGSDFWARTLAYLMGRMRDQVEATSPHKEDVATYIRSISATQEITVLSDHGPERVLVIYWQFRQSGNVQGRASWRKVVLPTASQQYAEPLKAEQIDPTFDFNTSLPEISTSQPVLAPTLQSPFEYDSSSASALSSATWPTSISDAGGIGAQNGHLDGSADNSFDFNGGHINIAYDPSLTIEGFDSSTFNFDATGVDFAADPALQDYSQQWADGYTAGFDSQHDFTTDAAFGVPTTYGAQEQGYHGYDGYDQQSYAATHEQQAYGGAGQDGVKQEDALAALADASYLAGTAVGSHNLA